MADTFEDRVRAIVREELDAAFAHQASALLPRRRSAVDPLRKQEDRVPDRLVLEPERLDTGTFTASERLDLVDHHVVQGSDLLDDVAHHDSSSLGPDAATSGSNPSVEATGDASSAVDSSAGRVTSPVIEVHGPAIREIRRRSGLGAAEFADAVGVSRAYTANIEHGRLQRVGLDIFTGLVAALGLQDPRAIAADPYNTDVETWIAERREERAERDRDVWHELRVIREKDGHTLTSLAKAAGMSLGYLSDLENGRRWPNARMTKRLATALNVPVSVLKKPRPIEPQNGAA